jgi:5-methylcytosine-specific restriction endonuclease McrA
MSVWRREVYERDGYQCGFCGEIGVRLQADHILPFSLYPEKKFDVANGQTLCKSCHAAKTKLDRIWYDNFTTRL